MGVYNGLYGHRARTPHMEAFGREATIFFDAHSAAPTCSPSRAALLTGESPHQAGMIGLAHRGFSLVNQERHLASVLGAAGWQTAMSGIQHEFNFACGCPYSEVLNDGSAHSADGDFEAAQAAATWLKNRDDTQPFFLWCGFFMPHVKFLKGDPTIDNGSLPACLPEVEDTRADWCDYLASVAATDKCMGVILNALAEAGHAEDTVVVLTTDHGVPFPNMKCNLTAHGTRITLAIRDPGGCGRGHISDALVSNLDVFPTLCDLVGFERPDWLQGHSLQPLMAGRVDAVREEIFTEVTYHACYEPMRGVRTKTGNYICRFDGPYPRRLANVDACRSKEFMMNQKWASDILPAESYYDLINDPVESCNRIADPAYVEIVHDLRGRLDRWMRATHDPLLMGAVPLPNGAVTNPINLIHPNDKDFIYG